MRLAIAVCALAAAASIRAQGLDPVGVDPRAGIQVDTVVATVNDTAVLLSELRTVAIGKVRGLERSQGRSLTNEERALVLQQAFRELLRDYTMAHAAKNLGLADPKMLESLLQDELQREAAEQVKIFGTELRFSQELQRLGITWQRFEDDKRTSLMRQFAEELAVYSRLQKQQNLFLTPRMMQELYKRNQARFVHPAQSLVGAVVFRGADAAERAAAAAAAWRQETLSSRELAARFPGATSLGELDPTTLKADLPLAKFGTAGPEGSVSEPIAFQGGFQVAKVLRFLPARNGRFEDPEVQAELRALGTDQVLAELRDQALQRAAARTEVTEFRSPR